MIWPMAARQPGDLLTLPVDGVDSQSGILRIKVVNYESGGSASAGRGEFFLVDRASRPLPAPIKEEWDRLCRAAEEPVVKHWVCKAASGNIGQAVPAKRANTATYRCRICKL
jgi:hypothetical protein